MRYTRNTRNVGIVLAVVFIMLVFTIRNVRHPHETTTKSNPKLVILHGMNVDTEPSLDPEAFRVYQEAEAAVMSMQQDETSSETGIPSKMTEFDLTAKPQRITSKPTSPQTEWETDTPPTNAQPQVTKVVKVVPITSTVDGFLDAKSAVNTLLKLDFRTYGLGITTPDRVPKVKKMCSFPDVITLPKIQFKRKTRKGVSETELMSFVEQSPHLHTVHVLEGSALPRIQHSVPISYSDPKKFDIHRPFGDWKIYFDKVVTSSTQYPHLLDVQPPLYVGVFKNVWVSNGNVITCESAFTTGACMWEFKFWDVTETYDAVVAICDEWCDGYFHFTHEHLPRIALVYELMRSNPEVKITVPKVGYVRSYLIDVFGFHPSQLVLDTRTFFARTAYYPQPQKCGNTYTATLMMMRSIVFERLNLTHTRTPVKRIRVLFAERNKLSRMPRNYNFLRDQLIAEYSDRVDFDTNRNKSVVEQIRAFNEADLVIGPHGANIANVMWMRHGAHIVEFISYPYSNMCYYVTAARMNVVFRIMFHPTGKHGHYNFTYDEMKRHVEDVLREAQASE